MAQEDQPLLGLEAKLRKLAVRGELTHFSIIPVAGKGPGGVVWCATYSPASKWGSGFGRDADPITAAMMAFKDVRLPNAVRALAETSPEAKAIAESVERGDSVPPDADAKLTAKIKRAKAVDGEADFL
jgi:hypothetical protein